MSAQQSPQKVVDTVMNSDLIYYIVPNFCGFPCANYFVFNERTVGYFTADRAIKKEYMTIPKRFIIVRNSENNAFTQTVRQQCEQPQILYLKTRQFGK